VVDKGLWDVNSGLAALLCRDLVGGESDTENDGESRIMVPIETQAVDASRNEVSSTG